MLYYLNESSLLPFLADLCILQVCQADLSTENEVVLRDRGYFGAEAIGIDFTMKYRTTDKPLDDLDKERNQLISKLKAPGERPHAVLKSVSDSGRVFVTTIKRVGVKMTVAASTFNLYQLCTLKKGNIIQNKR